MRLRLPQGTLCPQQPGFRLRPSCSLYPRASPSTKGPRGACAGKCQTCWPPGQPAVTKREAGQTRQPPAPQCVRPGVCSIHQLRGYPLGWGPGTHSGDLFIKALFLGLSPPHLASLSSLCFLGSPPGTTCAGVLGSGSALGNPAGQELRTLPFGGSIPPVGQKPSYFISSQTLFRPLPPRQFSDSTMQCGRDSTGLEQVTSPPQPRFPHLKSR